MKSLYPPHRLLRIRRSPRCEGGPELLPPGPARLGGYLVTAHGRQPADLSGMALAATEVSLSSIRSNRKIYVYIYLYKYIFGM